MPSSEGAQKEELRQPVLPPTDCPVLLLTAPALLLQGAVEEVAVRMVRGAVGVLATPPQAQRSDS